PRAAVQLAQMGDLEIPSVRMILEEAAAKHTRTPEVYLALANIYDGEVRRIEEAVRLTQQSAKQEESSPVPEPPTAEPIANCSLDMRASEANMGYSLLSDSERHPRVNRVTMPYYPAELLAEKVGGEVVLDVQVTEEGKVGGIWLISSTPEVFGNLATASVR